VGGISIEIEFLGGGAWIVHKGKKKHAQEFYFDNIFWVVNIVPSKK